jgi:hypothetical protein
MNEDVREAAIDGLAAMGGDEAAAALSVALRDEEPWNREEALDALVKIGGDQAAQSLAVALEVKDKSLRLNAVEALGEIGGETSAERPPWNSSSRPRTERPKSPGRTADVRRVLGRTNRPRNVLVSAGLMCMMARQSILWVGDGIWYGDP